MRGSVRAGDGKVVVGSRERKYVDIAFTMRESMYDDQCTGKTCAYSVRIDRFLVLCQAFEGAYALDAHRVASRGVAELN